MKKIYLLLFSGALTYGSDAPEHEIRKVPKDEIEKATQQLHESVKAFRAGAPEYVNESQLFQDMAICVQFRAIFQKDALDAVNPKKQSLFACAMQYEQWPLAKALIKQGAEDAYKDAYGRDRLHILVQKDQEELLELILKRDVNPDERDKNKETPLHYAVYYGKPKAVEILRRYHASKYALNHQHLTASMIAMKRKREDSAHAQAYDAAIEKLFCSSFSTQE